MGVEEGLLKVWGNGSSQNLIVSTIAATGKNITPTAGKIELWGVDIINPGFEASSIKTMLL
jgi:hypothetical protein